METIAWYRYEGCMNDTEGVGIEMERLAASMGGTHKFPYNDSECLDADFFKVGNNKRTYLSENRKSKALNLGFMFVKLKHSY